jgi:heme exporter protein C
MMREKVIYAVGLIGLLLLLRNLYVIFVGLPDEAMQGPIYRILFLHVPAAATFSFAAFASMIASVLYLARKNMEYDAFAVSVTEVGLVFAAMVLATGMIWARIIWGIWWAWDARLTSMLITFLMYSGYLMLRQAIDEPTQRARSAAVLSILTFPGVIITYKAIDWWRTQHPAPVLSFRTDDQRIDPAMEAMLYWNFMAMLLIAIVMVMARMHQERVRREVDGLRREAHAI